MKKLLLALALLLAACDGSHPAAAGARLDLRTEPGGGAVLPPRFDPGDGAVTVSGTVSTPCLNQRIAGGLRGSGAAITLTLSVLPSSGCLTAVGYVGYTARIVDLPAGTYDVRVVYVAGERAAPVQAGQARVRVR